MTGKEIRLERLFSRGKAVVVALDHGGYMGPVAGVVNLPEAITQFAEADAILVNPHMATQCGQFFAHRDAPLMIVRINWGSHYCPYFTEGYGPRTATVRRAVSVGADLVIVSLLLGVNERAHADNIELLGQLYEESETLGIPLIGEFIPVEGVHGKATDDEVVRVSVRLAAEVGVDAVKTVRTPGFKSVVEAVPVPVFALGGAKMKSEEDALQFARESLAEGAAGVVYGRNVFQAENPQDFLHQLRVVVKD